MEIYKQVLNMLDFLYMEQDQNQSSPISPNDNQYKINQSILLDEMDHTKLGSTVSKQNAFRYSVCSCYFPVATGY